MNISKEEQEELDDLAITLSYQAIKFSPLWKMLDNDAADNLALELSADVRARISLKIDEKIEQIAAAHAAQGVAA